MRLPGILLILAGASVAALAQTNAPVVRKMSLQDCIQNALSRNVDLQISRYTIPQAQLNLEAAYAGYDPTFTISGQHSFSKSGGTFSTVIGQNSPALIQKSTRFNSSLGGMLPWGLNYSLSGRVDETWGEHNEPFDSASGSASVNLSQPLLKNFWIDQTRLNIRVAKNRLSYTSLGWKQAIMNTVTSVEQAYYNLIYARENLKVQEKAVELAQKLVAENRTRVSVGAMAPLDEKQAESQAATSEAALIAAKSTLAVQENTLKQLLTDNFGAWRSVNIQPTLTLKAPEHAFNLQQSWREGLTSRPDLLQAKLDVEEQGIQVKFRFNQLFPELDLEGSYGHNAGGGSTREYSTVFDQIRQGSQPNYYFGGSLSIPLDNTAARAAYKQSKLNKQTAVLQLKKLEQNIMISIDNDIKQAQSSYQQVEATRAAREYAEDALAAEQKKLEQGKSTTYTVLQMQRDLTAARGNEIQAVVNYNNNLSQLSLDEGTTLQRLGLNLEVNTGQPWRSGENIQSPSQN